MILKNLNTQAYFFYVGQTYGQTDGKKDRWADGQMERTTPGQSDRLSQLDRWADGLKLNYEIKEKLMEKLSF
jgi:hypothetical protein